MNWVSIIAVVFSGIGVGVSIWAIIVAKKSNKAVLKQNLEKELAEIEQELADVEIQITEMQSKPRRVYGVVRPMDPEWKKMHALEGKKNALLKRKQEIIQQL